MADLLDELVDNMNGVGEAGDGLELPEDLGDAGEVPGPGAALGKAGAAVGAAQGLLDEDDGRAVGEVEGRRMVVTQPDSAAESLGALASSAASIALLGLPGKAVTTAVGSTL